MQCLGNPPMRMLTVIPRYVTQRGEQQLRDCEASIRQLSTDIEQRSRDIEVIREAAAKIEKEINESGSREANLRDNLRVRRLYKQIQDTQTEIESHDLEEAHRARRQFEQKYESAKKQEDQLHTEVTIVLFAMDGGSLYLYSIHISPEK